MLRLSCLLFIIWIFGVQCRFQCHKGCHKHGVCDNEDLCICFDGYTGADCSKSKIIFHIIFLYQFMFVKCKSEMCPYGNSWADKPYAADSAHYTAECSNRGFCDYSYGECRCLQGFEGDACQRGM